MVVDSGEGGAFHPVRERQLLAHELGHLFFNSARYVTIDCNRTDMLVARLKGVALIDGLVHNAQPVTITNEWDAESQYFTVTVGDPESEVDDDIDTDAADMEHEFIVRPTDRLDAVTADEDAYVRHRVLPFLTLVFPEPTPKSTLDPDNPATLPFVEQLCKEVPGLRATCRAHDETDAA